MRKHSGSISPLWVLTLTLLFTLSAIVGCTGGGALPGAVSPGVDPKTPTGPYGNSPVTSLAVGNYTACAIANNRLYCWGEQASEFKKELGSVRDPKQVAINDNNGVRRACVMSEKTVKCTDDRESHERNYKGLRQIAITAGQTCVLDADHDVSCFGDDTRRWDSWMSGKPTLEKPTMISGGNGRICAVDSTSKGVLLKCWGWVNPGQNTIFGAEAKLANPRSMSTEAGSCVADDSGILCSYPIAGEQTRVDIPGVRSLSQNWDYKKNTRLCAVATGKLMCWSQGARIPNEEIKAPAFKNLSSVVYTPSHFCATDDDGVKCWGDDPKWAAQVPKMGPPATIPIAANSYEGNGANKCSVAWNLKSSNFVACSNQLSLTFYKVENKTDPKTITLTRVASDGSTVAFRGVESTEIESRSFNIKLQAENGETMSLEGAKIDSSNSSLELGYVMLNGNSGQCIGLVNGDFSSCVKQWRNSDPRSDNLEFLLPKFSFALGAVVNAGGCSLKAVAQRDADTANFEVVSTGCVLNGKAYDQGETVEYRFRDENNYPVLSVPNAK